MKKLVAIIKNPWFTRIYMSILLIWIVRFFLAEGDTVLEILKTSKPGFILLAILCQFIAVGIINPHLHRIAYKEIGSVISFWQTFRIFHLSRIGNYLPGRVWFATNYYIFSKKMKIDTQKIAKNFVVLNALLFLVGSLCSLPIISLVSPAVQKLLVVFPLLMMILIHPKVFNLIFQPVLGKSGKEYRYSFLWRISLLYLIAYTILGLSLFFCILAFEPVEVTHLPLVIAAVSSSLIIGMLAIFAPAGIGVGEGIRAAALSLIVPLEIAIMIVFLFRIVMMIVDFGCALVSAVSVAREEKAVGQVLA